MYQERECGTICPQREPNLGCVLGSQDCYLKAKIKRSGPVVKIPIYLTSSHSPFSDSTYPRAGEPTRVFPTPTNPCWKTGRTSPQCIWKKSVIPHADIGNRTLATCPEVRNFTTGVTGPKDPNQMGWLVNILIYLTLLWTHHVYSTFVFMSFTFNNFNYKWVLDFKISLILHSFDLHKSVWKSFPRI
jgi:hypothetical protein